MNALAWLTDRLRSYPDRLALIEDGKSSTYGELAECVEVWKSDLSRLGYGAGSVIGIQSDYSVASISLLLACIELSQVAVLLSTGIRGELGELLEIAEVEVAVRPGSDTEWIRQPHRPRANTLLKTLAISGESGLVLFSSGSAGKPKASLHAWWRFLAKFERMGDPLRTVAVPPMDHVAGLDTMFSCLTRGGTLVCSDSRSPDGIAQLVERHRVELLPASATFINLMVASRACERYDLSSLRVIAYGSDVMPQGTLSRLRELLPDVKCLQKYGTTEFGSPSTKSQGEGSLYLKIQDPGVETRIVDGLLWVRSQSAMLGYLNADSPFEADGWMNTGDVVEEMADGYIRILGRKSDVINVGGHKVFPAEVEAVLLQLSNIADVSIYGHTNALLGRVVAARIRLYQPERLGELKKRVRQFCSERLASYKVPVVIELTESDLMTERHKKVRRESMELRNGAIAAGGS